MTDAARTIYRVAVVLSGREAYGIRQSLLTQRTAAERHGVRFEYVCLRRGPLCEAIEQAGSPVTVCGGDVPQRLSLGPVLTYARWLLPGGGFGQALRGVRRYLQTHDVDVVYSHSPNMHLVCGLAVRSASCRAVGHVHGPLNPRRLLGINRALYCAMMHRMLDAIVTISHYARGTLCGAARRRSVMVYNGGDLQAIHRHARSCPVDGNTLVLVGRLVDWKKQALAIRALHLLRDEFPDSTLEFLGGPVDAANAYCVELQALVDALGLTDRIRFRGEISPPYDPVAAATICVSCATMEAFGNAVLEAMALQTPVIVADRSAPAEFVRDGVTGLHYEADNPEALAAAIRRILRDPDLGRRLADAAWEDIRRPFDIDTHMERMRNVFSSVCDR